MPRSGGLCLAESARLGQGDSSSGTVGTVVRH